MLGDEFIGTAENSYRETERQVMKLVEVEAEAALQTYQDSVHTQDPWLWDLEWKIASKKTIKARRIAAIHLDKEILAQQFQGGVPTWYQELADETDGRPFLNLSTSKRAVPKLLRLTWKGFPLHHHKVEKWGYLVPTADAEEILGMIECGEIETSFPLRQFLEVLGRETKQKPVYMKDVDIDEIINELDDVGEEKVDHAKKVKHFPRKQKKIKTDEVGIDIGLPGVRFCGLPHKNGAKFRVGNPLGKDFVASVAEGGDLASHKPQLAEQLLKLNMCLSYWRSSRDRIGSQLKVELEPESGRGAILPCLVTAGTITRRAVERTWLTASNAKPDRIGSELKAYIRAPPGHHLVGADVDSQELWLAALLGDAKAGGHGATPFGWMCLQGDKNQGTDLHSKTAAAAQVTRDEAKILNYGRIYGAGEPFAKQLLMQFNPRLTEAEAGQRARHMYEQTKGNRGYLLNKTGTWLWNNLGGEAGLSKGEPYIGQVLDKSDMMQLGKLMAVINALVSRLDVFGGRHQLSAQGQEFHPGRTVTDEELVRLVEELRTRWPRKMESFKGDWSVRESLVQQVVWSGGSESHTFNRLEEIAMSRHPVTPVLGAEITRALETALIGRGFLTSRINWVVQSSAVDFLHLLLSCMDWLLLEFRIPGRLVLSIHDEVRMSALVRK